MGDEEKSEEIRMLLSRAKEDGAAAEELEGLEASLRLLYKKPERHQRYPTLKDARIKSKPLPYRNEEVREE